MTNAIRPSLSLRSLLLSFAIIFLFAPLYGQWEELQNASTGYRLLEVPKNNIAIVGHNMSYRILTQDSTIMHDIEGGYSHLNASYFVDDQVGYVGGGCYFTGQDCPAYAIYKTIDAAKTWTRVESPVSFRGVGNVKGMAVVGHDELLVLHEYGGLLKLNLADNSVDSIKIDSQDEANRFDQLEVYDDQHWLMSYFVYQLNSESYNKYFYTEDAGLTWNELTTDSSHEDFFYEVKYLSKNSWIGGTNTGKIYEISGQRKTELFDPGNSKWNRVHSIFVVNNKYIYAAAYDGEENIGALYRSINSGLDWELEYEKEGMQINQMMFNSPGHGFAFGGHKFLLERKPDTLPKTPILDIKVFPNPTRVNLCVPIFEELRNVKVELYDSLGKLVRRKKMNYGNLRIANLGAGTYVARFFDDSDALLGQAHFVKVR